MNKILIIAGYLVYAISPLTITHQSAQAQPIILESQFDNAKEISSLILQNDRILLIAEKCKKLYYLDSSGKVSSELPINNGSIKNREVEIEGAAWFKNGLLMTNEKVGELLYLDLKFGTINKVETDFDMSMDIGNQGMEGIAVDSIRKLCYILKEKNGNKESVVRVFSIRSELGVPGLRFVKNVRVSQPDNVWRFSDLVYNSVDDNLYFLRTKKGEYQIVKIESSVIMQTGNESLVNATHDKNLSSIVKSYGDKGYNLNLEGIGILDGFFYLVSDNATSDVAKCSIKGEGKTLLLKVPF